MTATPDEQAARAAAAIAAYSPSGVSTAAASFAREVASLSAPASVARARALLFCASRLGAFGESLGLQASADVLLCEALIERFILQGAGAFSPASRRTLRSNLRALARALQAHPAPRPTALPRERAKAPYSDAEIAGYLRLALAQSTEARRMRATALLCLGAGAGIVASELRHICGSDVLERSGGVLVLLRAGAPPRARSVPVLRRYQEPLLGAARFAGERLILGGEEPSRRNITDSLGAALSSDPALARLEGGRLRSTWLTEVAGQIGLPAFMAAAGVRCSQRLGDIAALLPVPSEAEIVASLGGSP